MTSPGGARSSALAHPVPDQPGPFLRLDHSSDQAARAADTLAARWEAVDAPPWYAARPIGAAVGVVLLLTLALLATLRPPPPQ